MNRRVTIATLAASSVGLLVPLTGAERVSTQPVATPAAGPATVVTAAADRDDAVLPGVAGDRRGAAHAVLRIADGSRVGKVTFVRDPRGGTIVRVVLDLPGHLNAGNAFHGFHVHANNDPSNGNGCKADPTQPPETHFTSADGHFTEPEKTHGRHLGDLPALYVRRGGASEAVVVTDRFRPRDVVGRAIMLHAKPDNFGNVPVGKAAEQYRPRSKAAEELTRKTGNAGARIACGVIRSS